MMLPDERNTMPGYHGPEERPREGTPPEKKRREKINLNRSFYA
jgi:hypothetical protein